MVLIAWHDLKVAVGRAYAAVVTVRHGRVLRVQEYPHLAAALEALGLDEEA